MENSNLYSSPKSSSVQRWKTNSPSAPEMRNKTELLKLENKTEYLSRKQLLRKAREHVTISGMKHPHITDHWKNESLSLR